MRDNGYDVEDYYAVDPQFGSMEDMDALLARAEELGIRVITDMVLNHTSDRHRWFQEALKDPKSKYRDYYIFKESKERPSNARSCFGGSVWEKVEGDVWYYHTFDKTQPDLNWECKELRQEIYRILNYWLDKGVSGFRMDAITYIKKGDSLKDAEPQGEDGLHDVADIGLNQPGIGEFLLEMRKECIDGRDAMTVAEAPGVPYDKIGEFIGEKRILFHDLRFQLCGYRSCPRRELVLSGGLDISSVKETDLPQPVKRTATGLGSHLSGKSRPVPFSEQIFPDKAARPYEVRKRFLQSTALGTLLFGLRGTVFLYQGEELGMTNCPFASIDEFDDLNTIDQYYRALKAGCDEKKALKFVNDRSRTTAERPIPGVLKRTEDLLKARPG